MNAYFFSGTGGLEAKIEPNNPVVFRRSRALDVEALPATDEGATGVGSDTRRADLPLSFLAVAAAAAAAALCLGGGLV